MLDSLSTVTCSDHGGYTILASNDGTMTQNTANICDQSLRVRKELRPRWRRHGTYQNGSGKHIAELGRIHDHAGLSGDGAGAYRNTH